MIVPKAYIHLDRLKQNIWNIRRNIGNRNLMIVVKANGYGHGSLNIAKHLSDEPGITFCVFTIQEGIDLRREGINNPILIFSRIHKDWIALAIKYKLWVNACHQDDLILLDMGTGLRNFGNSLLKENSNVKNINVFLSHYHYYHILMPLIFLAAHLQI